MPLRSRSTTKGWMPRTMPSASGTSDRRTVSSSCPTSKQNPVARRPRARPDLPVTLLAVHCQEEEVLSPQHSGRPVHLGTDVTLGKPRPGDLEQPLEAPIGDVGGLFRSPDFLWALNRANS